jgi:hypothetical protein
MFRRSKEEKARGWLSRKLGNASKDTRKAEKKTAKKVSKTIKK